MKTTAQSTARLDYVFFNSLHYFPWVIYCSKYAYFGVEDDNSIRKDISYTELYFMLYCIFISEI